MNVKHFPIKGLVEFEPRIFNDDRGFFFESFNQNVFEEHLPGVKFVQDNQSFSKQGTLRGLHLQKEPFAQGKLVRVITGKALDVAVDVRQDSPTYGQYQTFLLDSEKNNMAYIPEGFAHGFLALEDCIFSYKCTNFYNKESESGVIWNDPNVDIDWGIEHPSLSEKDLILPPLASK